jgi:NAD(P)-dependent dehydrogenase (short-subunit alcohol dehydrogenase family)
MSAPPPDPYLADRFSLDGRAAVVTGGSSGIGRGVAEALARAGATVAIVARHAAPLAREAGRIDETVGRSGAAHAFAADLTDRAELARVAAGIEATVGPPAILVNNAAVNERPPLDELTEETWDRTIALNLTTPFLLGQRFAPGMAASGYGRIINLASQQAISAFGNSGAYGASKAGLVGLTRSQAEAWATSGVTANAVSPAFVETPSTAPVFADPERAAGMAARTMVGRNGTTEDLEGLVVFLAGPAAGAITGQLLFADLGFSAH